MQDGSLENKQTGLLYILKPSPFRYRDLSRFVNRLKNIEYEQRKT